MGGRKEEEDSLGLGSRADQGPWSSAASAPSVIRGRWPTPTRRNSRATGKLLGETSGGRRGRKNTKTGREASRRRVFFLLLFKKKKWDGYERSEGEGTRRGGTATAGPPRSTAARCRTTAGEKLLSFSKNDLTGFQAHEMGSRHRRLRCALSARGYPLSHAAVSLRLLCDDNPRSSHSGEPQRPENPVV